MTVFVTRSRGLWQVQRIGRVLIRKADHSASLEHHLATMQTLL